MFFFEKSLTKCGGETISITFSKKSKTSISHILLFIVRQVECPRSILKLSCRSLAFTSFEAFLKNQKRSGNSLPGSFLAFIF